MRDLTVFEIHENICDLYNIYEDSHIEFGRKNSRKIGRVLYAKSGFVKILFRGDIKTEIIQTTHLILRPVWDMTMDELDLVINEEDPYPLLAAMSIDAYGLSSTAYAVTNG